MKPKHEPQTRPTMFCLDGRASPFELIVHAANASGATGIGSVLDYRELDRDRQR